MGIDSDSFYNFLLDFATISTVWYFTGILNEFYFIYMFKATSLLVKFVH